jgi:CRP/FNR family transcriptional regulator, cyclic AMP receptor protein
MLPAPDRLPQVLLDAMVARGSPRHFPANAILINEDDTTDSLYIVLSGRVKVYASGESGREVVLGEIGPAEYFGELSLFGAPRSASVKTILPTDCSIVQAADLRQLLTEHPDLALHLTAKLTHMVRRLTKEVKSLALQDVYGRIVRVLMELSEVDGDRRVIRQKLTQQDIADRVGSSREMVSRIFKELSSGGYVSVRPDHCIVIHKKPPPAW